MFRLLVLLLATCFRWSAGHNWIDNPSSRCGGGLSKTAPCPKRKSALYHNIMVGPGQKFALQWSAGHGGATYFAVVAREHESKLKSLSDAIMTEYLADAPAGSKSSDPGGWMSGAENKKVHLRYAKDDSTFPLGGARDLTTYKTSVYGSRVARPYSKRLNSSDPGWLDVPSTWRCVRNSANKGLSRPARNQLPVNCNNEANRLRAAMGQFSYSDHYTRNDVAAGYASAKYPWLTAVYKFTIIKHAPMDSDFGWFTLPPHAAPGEYVINYRWRGYYDCFDVVLLTEPANDVYGRKSSTAVWQKMDHSQFPWHGPKGVKGMRTVGQGDFRAVNPTFHQGMLCIIVDQDAASRDIQGYLDICAGWIECEAINCVPVYHDEEFDRVRFRDPQLVNAPYVWGYPKRCTSAFIKKEAKKAKNPLVCYGFKLPVERPETGERFVTVNADPRDPVFYSTAFQQFTIRAFTGNNLNGTGASLTAPVGAPAPPAFEGGATDDASWRFGGQCISCEDAERNRGLSSVSGLPSYVIAKTCRNCNNPTASPTASPTVAMAYQHSLTRCAAALQITTKSDCVAAAVEFRGQTTVQNAQSNDWHVGCIVHANKVWWSVAGGSDTRAPNGGYLCLSAAQQP